jgi:hypothetical protein
MTGRSSSSRSTGVWPSMPMSAVQNTISPVSGLISQWCFVVGLIGQRVRDLLQVEATQVKHLARISLSRCPHSRIWNARTAADEWTGPSYRTKPEAAIRKCCTARRALPPLTARSSSSVASWISVVASTAFELISWLSVASPPTS